MAPPIPPIMHYQGPAHLGDHAHILQPRPLARQPCECALHSRDDIVHIGALPWAPSREVEGRNSSAWEGLLSSRRDLGAGSEESAWSAGVIHQPPIRPQERHSRLPRPPETSLTALSLFVFREAEYLVMAVEAAMAAVLGVTAGSAVAWSQ